MGPDLKDAAILIVDDQESNVLLLQRLLEEDGYFRILTTTDSSQASKLFIDHQADLILLDLLMPHPDGFEVMEELRKWIPANTYLPILVLTADITAQAKQKALAKGARDFLTKPFNPVEVLLRIRNLLETRFLYLEVQQQNRTLENKVAERTKELKALSITEREQRRLAETLSQSALALSQSLDLNIVLETLLDYLETLIHYDSANIMLLETEHQLAMRVMRHYDRWTDPEMIRSVTFDIDENPILQKLFSTRESVLVSNTQTEPGWDRNPSFAFIQSWLGVPLVENHQVIGICAFDKGEPGYFTREHAHLAELLVGQAAIAVQNAWLYNQVKAGRERLQSLSRRLVEVQEEERRYISRELHDQAGQSMTSLILGLGQLEKDAGLQQQGSQIAELKSTANTILEDLHRLAMDLRPASLDHIGLVPTLRQFVLSIGARKGLDAKFEALGFDHERLSPHVETTLYRIVQEAVTNVVKHARARHVDVFLKRSRDWVILVIEDDGVGFDVDFQHGMSPNSLGIQGMHERAEMLGGSLVIESSVGSGTTIKVEIPYTHT